MVPMSAVPISSAAVMFPSSRSRFCVFSTRSAAARTVKVVAMTSLACSGRRYRRRECRSGAAERTSVSRYVLPEPAEAVMTWTLMSGLPRSRR